VVVRDVLRLPARVLKLRAEELGGDLDQALMQDLVDTMRASPACVGLAAPQIGISKRAIVVDVSAHPKATIHHGLIALFDPVVVDEMGRSVGREGCMSVPHLTANVARAEGLTVAGIGIDGLETVVGTEGFEARALLHEIDHLDGALILDRVTSLTDDVFRRRVYR
jgi:peptide deformylase